MSLKEHNIGIADDQQIANFFKLSIDYPAHPTSCGMPLQKWISVDSNNAQKEPFKESNYVAL